MKVLVVSGFLGAGKTTFIKELSKRTHRDFAVMENEYGEVNIDGQLLNEDKKDAPEKINIWEMTEGCICCSMKSDFASSVLTIANTVDPEFLIVEPTGVGMLSKVMENLSKIQYERISLLSPVTLLDGNSFERYRKEFPEIYRDQVSSAGTILISKMENADQETLSSLKEEIRDMNKNADIFEKHYSLNEDGWWEEILSRPFDPAHKLRLKVLPPELDNLGLTQVSLPSGNHLILFLQGVVSGVFGNIVRAKGYLKAGNAFLHFEVTDRTYSVTGIDEMPDSRAVFIGKNLKRNDLRYVLQKDLRIDPVQK